MINYFKDLLATLKSIDSSLKKIASAVRVNHRSHGASHYMNMGHWNE